ncbi:MAG: sigma-54 dependent transcriptional regulator [Verrucomicrobiota bacterium]|nr:sigma-54 dependent transcriptional regulator [Verrucomicrobiota bacterium]
MKTRARILLVEDDAQIATALTRVLADENYEVTQAADGSKGLALAGSEAFDLVITDFKMPGLTGIELVQRLHDTRPRLPVILMTAHGTTDTAIEATKLGAYDYLLKPFEMPDLLALVEKAVASSRLMLEPIDLGKLSPCRSALVGNSRAMQEIYKEIGRVAAKPVTVLIRGETGTGKELVARAIYQHSDRAEKPFIAVNCAAIPETLLESELFGHEKGAFTGADVRRIGRFEQAHQGTIFLDEIGDMSSNTQAKLLRVLQEKSIQRVGGREVIPTDVRIIAATHRDLEAAMQAKEFREDLFYRLNVVALTIPPLRQRSEDIADLTRYFLLRHAVDFNVEAPAIDPPALEFLTAQSWPGNVRELENTIRRALALARGYSLGLEEVRAAVTFAQRPAEGAQSLADFVGGLIAAASRGEIENVHSVVIESAERALFSQAIKLAHGNQAKAARWLGVSRATMREKLHQFAVHPAS